jgi:hypothetical protein
LGEKINNKMQMRVGHGGEMNKERGFTTTSLVGGGKI